MHKKISKTVNKYVSHSHSGNIGFLTLWVISLIFILYSAAIPAIGQVRPETTARFAKPVNPVDAIIEAFKTHNVVALTEGTDLLCIPEYEFRSALLKDPRFPEVVNDIVVGGNSLYQGIMDRFISGKEVPYDELQKATQIFGGIWTAPVYEEFFREVRKLNSTLPESRQIRVLLGYPSTPDECDRQSDKEYFRWFSQWNSYPAELIRHEVIDNSRRVLLIYGSGHLLKKYPFSPLSRQEAAEAEKNPPSIVMRLEKEGIKVFSIWVNSNDDLNLLQPDIVSWKTPGLSIVKNTVLGLAPIPLFYKKTFPDDKGQTHIPDPDAILMQNQFDAILVFASRTPDKDQISIEQAIEIAKKKCEEEDEEDYVYTARRYPYGWEVNCDYPPDAFGDGPTIWVGDDSEIKGILWGM